MGACIDPVEFHALGAEEFPQASVNRLHLGQVEKTPPHSRLVGNDDQPQAHGPHTAEPGGGGGQQADVPRLGEIFLLLDDRAVTIQGDKSCLGHGRVQRATAVTDSRSGKPVVAVEQNQSQVAIRAALRATALPAALEHQINRKPSGAPLRRMQTI